jgi:hypothetical protein
MTSSYYVAFTYLDGVALITLKRCLNTYVRSADIRCLCANYDVSWSINDDLANESMPYFCHTIHAQSIFHEHRQHNAA